MRGFKKESGVLLGQVVPDGGVRAGVLSALLGRVQAAEGPDREIDAEIAVALSGDPEAWVVNPSPHSIFAPVPGWWRDGHDKSHCAPELTASLDAGLALCERVLPGWKWFVSFGYEDSDGGPFYAMVREHGHAAAEPVSHSASAPLALLAAMLKALGVQS